MIGPANRRETPGATRVRNHISCAPLGGKSPSMAMQLCPVTVVMRSSVQRIAVFFTALGAALIKGADLRPIGNLAVPVGVLAAFYVTLPTLTP